MRGMTIRFSDEEHKKLVERAERDGSTVAETVKQACFGKSFEQQLQDVEARISERIADFRKNLVAEIEQQKATR